MEEVTKVIKYWRNKLQDVPLLQLPTDFIRPLMLQSQVKSVEFQIEKELSNQLEDLSKQEGTTLFMTMLAAFKVLLHRYSGQQDICVGTYMANHGQQLDEEGIDFCINTLALRSEVKGDESVNEFLQRLKGIVLEAYEHHDVPFEKVVEAVVKERNPGHNPLFQVMLVLHNTLNRLGEVELSVEEFSYDTVRFDITFLVKETKDGLQGNVQYATDLYSEATINRMISHYKTLLGSIVKGPQQKIHELTMLTEEEKQQLLSEFNQTKVDYPIEKSIVDLFEEQTAKTPESVAVVFEKQQLTYKELNERANQLAHYLRNKGVSEETLVPICIERSADMIVGILGILKAGGAYVPIDIEFPKERIVYMLEDSAASLVVTGKESKINFPAELDIIEIDSNSEVISNKSTENLQVKVPPHNLAYVIYTSGSTGKPKGVMIEHKNLVDYLFGLKQKTQIDQCKSFALVSTIATDLGNTVLFSSLVFGGSLHLFSKETVSNIENLHEYFVEHKIDCLKIVPSHWKALSVDEQLLLPVELLIFGGEALESEVAEKIRLSGSKCKIINHYGPTETTIGKLLHIVSKDREYGSTIPIGKPFSNTRVYVLNKELAMCPVGVSGQLFIEGDGVARGYLNNAELTMQKFIQNPFNNKEKSLMYSTGDLVKYLPDGNIEFIGRVDDQIKIRGFRIELGEIESILREYKEVRQAAVLAKDGSGGKRLVAYVVTNGLFNSESIIAYLKDRLPDYMVPALIVELKSLPLTANGKIDRHALPDPDANEMLSGKYVAPRNIVEEKLVAIWQDVLGLDKVGVNDDFFELGGHSLLAIRLISAIRKEFTVEMPIGDIFEYSTIESLQVRLQSPSGKEAESSILLISRPEYIPLSFSQERLWFLDQLEGSVQYNRSFIWRLKGALNKQALANALQDIVTRHEVLRTVILEQEGEPYQFVNDSIDWHLEILDGSSYLYNPEALQERIQHFILKPFNLPKDYMIRAHLLSLTDDEYVLIVTMHHIASDGWSTSIFVNEVMEFYNAYVEGRPVKLSPLSVQYADYSVWQRNNLQDEVLDKKVEYWKDKLKGVAVLQLPTDYQRPAERSSHGALLTFNINKLLSDQLEALSREEGATLYMFLLATFNVLLHRYSGQEDICVGSPIANRTQKEVEGLIGFFVNTLALRSEVRSESSFKELLQQVKATTMEAYEHLDVPFEKIVEAVVKERDLSRNPLFQVMLAMRNTPEVPQLNFGEVHFSPEEFEYTTAIFDINFYITETADGLEGEVHYATDLYNEETIVRMMGHFTTLLSSIVKSPQQKIGLLQMLTAAEEQELLVEFNDTKVDYPKDKTIVNLFEEQSVKTPNAIAVIFEDEQLTYKQLNEKANQLAHYLKSKGVKQETLVPICIERCLEMIIGILGILKAGGVYVPIDPGYPDERISFMLEDTKAALVISSKESRLKLKGIRHIEVIEIHGNEIELYKQSPQNLKISIQPHHLAYIIFTSGSTGRPKGVLIEHRNVVRLFQTEKPLFDFNEKDVWTMFHSFCFDFSVWEMYGALFYGGRVIVVPDSVIKDARLFSELLVKEKVTVLNQTPSAFYVLQDQLVNEIKDLSVRYVIFGGEALNPSKLQPWKQTYENSKLINMYGITETTVHVTYQEIGWEQMQESASIIGTPIPTLSVYILDSNSQPFPIGVAGEIYVGGAGVARGYLNRPELSKERFISNHFSKDGEEKLYKTGDLARWLVDGNIEYLGRIDDQVKIRGYRIELGEIENILQQCEGVNQGVVLAREDHDGNKRLVGYVVPADVFDKEAIVSYLKKMLPEYMVPAIWVELDSLPLTSNGKTDRKALPDPDVSHVTDQYTAPRSELQIKLSNIWQELLGIEKISIHNNFFELGGHSLLAMRVISAIRKDLQVELAIKDLFQYTTINQLSEYIESEYDFAQEIDPTLLAEIKI